MQHEPVHICVDIKIYVYVCFCMKRLGMPNKETHVFDFCLWRVCIHVAEAATSMICMHVFRSIMNACACMPLHLSPFLHASHCSLGRFCMHITAAYL